MDLAGQILIAMPGMADPRFERSVVLICAHSEEGAMGLIVNKPLEDLSFSGLLEHLNIPLGPAGRDIRVLFGGPVERGRGFVRLNLATSPEIIEDAVGRMSAAL